MASSFTNTKVTNAGIPNIQPFNSRIPIGIFVLNWNMISVKVMRTFLWINNFHIWGIYFVWNQILCNCQYEDVGINPILICHVMPALCFSTNNWYDAGIPYLQQWFVDGGIPRFGIIIILNCLIISKFSLASFLFITELEDSRIN